MLGRLETVAARRWFTVAFVVLHPLLAWIQSGSMTPAGHDSVMLTTGASLALLLSVGPWGAAVVAVMDVVSPVLVRGADPTTALMLCAVVEAVVLMLVAVLLEERFRALGPVRRPRVVVEFTLLAAVLGPAVVVLGDAAIAVSTTAGPMSLSAAIGIAAAHGIGVLTITPGIRIAVRGGPVLLVRGDAAVVATGVVATAVVLVGTVIVLGASGTSRGQLAIVPLLLVGFLAGTNAYAVTVGAATLVTTTGIVLFAAEPTTTQLGQHLAWWALVAIGLLLASEGDQRRQVTAKLANLFDHAAAPSAEVDDDGRVLQVNRAFAAMLGWRPAELVDSDLLMLFASDDDGAGVEALVSGYRDEVRGQASVTTRTGALRQVRYTGRRLHDAGTGGSFLLVQLLDMTDEERRAEELQRSNEALERLGTRISHDLKQPLAAIAGYASTLKVQRARLDQATIEEMLDRLDLAARRVVDQLDSLVESARVGGDAAESVSLADVVATVTGLVDIELRETGGRIDTALTLDRVRTDPRALQQVLFNIVTNALKYHDGTLPPRVLVTSRARGPGVEITVTDNGPGIAHENLESVFEPGRRLDPAVASGRGMGLADSRRAVEDLGGWLRAEPSAAGARFVLWLPDTTAGGERAVVRVVVVDREDGRGFGESADVAPLVLEHDRLSVVGRARSTAEAVSLVSTLAPDAVLLDRWTSDGDGVRALASLATAHPPARLVVRTRDRSPDSVRAALLGGATRAVDNAADGREVADVLVTAAG